MIFSCLNSSLSEIRINCGRQSILHQKEVNLLIIYQSTSTKHSTHYRYLPESLGSMSVPTFGLWMYDSNFS